MTKKTELNKTKQIDTIVIDQRSSRNQKRTKQRSRENQISYNSKCHKTNDNNQTARFKQPKPKTMRK